MLWLLLFVCIILWLYHVTRRDKRMELLFKQIPFNAPQLPILGHAYKYMGSGISKCHEQYSNCGTTNKGGLMGIWHLNTLYLVVSDADSCEYILKHCLEKDDLVKLIYVFLGNASVFAPVSIWRPRRKLHISNFNQKRLNGFVEVFSKHSQVLAEKLKLLAGEEPVSVWPHLHSYALDVSCESIMGVHVNAQQNRNNIYSFMVAFLEIERLIADRLIKPWLHSDFIYNLICYKYKEHKATVSDFTKKLIEERRKLAEINSQVLNENSPKKENHFSKSFVDNMLDLTHLSTEEQESANIMLQEEIAMLIGAGTDTTAVVSSFTTVILSRHPHVQEKVYEELQAVFGDSDRPVAVEDLSHLKYLEAVIKETMRLYPPGPIIARKVENDMTLPSGTNVVKGCGIFINIWATNRNPAYWGADADEFRPERFLEAPLTHSAAYLSFSYGPRGCIGMQFAYMSLKTLLATILRSVRLLPAPDPVTGVIPASDEPLKLTFQVLARHVDNYMVRLEKRSDVVCR